MVFSIIRILFVIVIFLTSVYPAIAQGAGALSSTDSPHLQQVRDRIEDKREAMQEKREEIRARFLQIRDERRKKRLERIEDTLARINIRCTSHFTKVLARLENILERITSRKDKLSEDGKDVSAVESAISLAQAAIEAATDAVEAQIAKEYSLESTDETAKNIAGQAFSTLQTDLRSVKELLKAARTAVKDATVALAQASGTE